MEITALLLSRIQFAFTITFHIIFPSFSIGLAAWLTVLEGLHLATGRPVYRVIFDFWLKIFGVALGLGVVSGIVMAFQFGTNWSELSKAAGPIQGPLIMYETFTAFMLEASFFGVLIFGRSRVPPWLYFISTAMVALGTMFSAFWIMVNNSWMQVPSGYILDDGGFVPNDWTKIIFNSVVWSRFPHMLLASYLTSAFCVAATGAWYVLRKEYHAEARIMLHMGLGLAAVLVPIQLFFGHLCGGYVNTYQPSKMAAIEGRWNDEKPAGEVLFAWPDVANRRDLFAITLPPPFGSLIDSDSLTAGETGLNSIAPENWPPVVIPFFSFRIMVGCGIVMLGLAWLGTYLGYKHRLERNCLLLWTTFLSFPLPFIAILTGWFTADDPRGDDLARHLLHDLQLHILIRHVLHLSADPHRPRWRLARDSASRDSRPTGVPGQRRPHFSRARSRRRWRIAMVMFWISLLALSILLYVLLDGADLGVGMLFGLTQGEARRRIVLSAVAPIWDGNETWLVVSGVILWGAFPLVYATLLSAFYLPLFLILAGLILRGVAFEFRDKTRQMRWIWDLSFAGGSLIASFMQGTTVGALVEGLPFAKNGQYSGGDFGWLTPFAALCGIGLCLGYALLGACWLVMKCEGEVRDTARRQIRVLAVCVLAFLVVVFVYALAEHLPILHRWIDRPYLFVFPAIGAAAAIVLALSILNNNDRWPFYTVAVIFVSAFGTLALSFWPYMIPFVVTIKDAAAPQSSLAFMFWGGVIVFPLMLLYTVISYSVFRGKVRTTAVRY